MGQKNRWHRFSQADAICDFVDCYQLSQARSFFLTQPLTYNYITIIFSNLLLVWATELLVLFCTAKLQIFFYLRNIFKKNFLTIFNSSQSFSFLCVGIPPLYLSYISIQSIQGEWICRYRDIFLNLQKINKRSPQSSPASLFSGIWATAIITHSLWKRISSISRCSGRQWRLTASMPA